LRQPTSGFLGNLAAAEAATPGGSLGEGTVNFGTWNITVTSSSLTFTNPTGVCPTQTTKIDRFDNGIYHTGCSTTTNFPPTASTTPIGGSVTGTGLKTVICKNITTGQAITIRKLKGATSWDCTTAGLQTNKGDIIKETLTGAAK
jgi:hypothetical protein